MDVIQYFSFTVRLISLHMTFYRFIIVALGVLFVFLYFCLFVWFAFICHDFLFVCIYYLLFFFFLSRYAACRVLVPWWGSSLDSCGGSLESGHQTAREFPGPGHKLSQRSAPWHQDPDPLNCLQAPVLDEPAQKTSKTRTKTPPIRDSMPKVMLKYPKIHLLTWPWPLEKHD